jgi:anti-anti-sigma factor
LKAHFDLGDDSPGFEAVSADFTADVLTRPAVWRNDTTTYLTFPGRLSGSEAKKVLGELKEHLAEDEPVLVVDMAHTRSLGTAGLDLLLDCVAEVTRRDGSFSVSRVSPEAATLIELTGLGHLLNVSDLGFEEFGLGTSVEQRCMDLDKPVAA